MARTGLMIGCVVAIVVVLLVAAIGGVWYIRNLNKVVALDEKVSESWHQVDVVLQRRYDLIPNLVSTVKGYAEHEEKIFTEVARLRSQWAAAGTRAGKIKAATQLEGAISRLLLVAENYPQLRASENFRELQVQLEGTENRIAQERRRYNREVKEFNYYIRTVFGRHFAGKRNLTEPAKYFEITSEEARETPKVEF